MALKWEQLRLHSDARGVVFEPLATGQIALQRNAHVVISRPGVVRGNHHHLRGTETIAVAGPALLRIREEGKVRDIEIPDEEVHRFVFPPGVSHALKNTGDRTNVLVAFNTCVHDPAQPDTVQDILIEG